MLGSYFYHLVQRKKTVLEESLTFIYCDQEINLGLSIFQLNMYFLVCHYGAKDLIPVISREICGGRSDTVARFSPSLFCFHWPITLQLLSRIYPIPPPELTSSVCKAT